MSTDSLFSDHWHRVRDVCPRLADDVVVTPHVYRGRACQVLQRQATNACHRLDPASFELIERLDGRISVGALWEQALVERDEQAPTQDAWMHLLAGLHAAELLVVDRRIATEQLFERRETRRARTRREQRTNPLYLRFALHDPDAWLERLIRVAHGVFSRTAAVAWLGLMSLAALVLVVNGDELAEALRDPSLLSPRSLLLFALVYPPLKLLHELGHALAVKRGGGAVRETGLALMVLMPVPYVDASASAAFADKRQRMLVSAAGILVELTFAAVGALLWASASGTVQQLGLVLLLTGGLSTLLINGNPLLRFDGYYLLADWLEIPNLASRSRRHVLALLRRGLRGPASVDQPAEPSVSSGSEDSAERAWLIGYGLAAGVYRTGLMLSIAWWLSDRFLVVGLALALFALITAVGVPVWRGAVAVHQDPGLQSARPMSLLIGGPGALVALALWMPLPQASVTRGVVWLPDEAIVRATSACEIDGVAVSPGQDVTAGQMLFECVDPELGLRELALQARLDVLDARLGRVRVNDPREYARLKPDRAAIEVALTDARHRLGAEQHRAALDGRFDTRGTHALAGRALRRGDIAGFVVPPDRRTIRMALDERAVGRLDTAAVNVTVRTAAGAGAAQVHRTWILRRTPRATREVVSAALSAAGGGQHAVAPGGDGTRLLEPVFDLELAWPASLGSAAIGEVVGVRFAHRPAPLIGRFAERLRRAFAERGQA